MYQINKVRTHYISKILTISFFAFLMAGCFQKNLPIAGENANVGWAKRSQSLQKLTHWQVKGKAAFQSTSESGSASFDWRQQQDQFIFAAFTPLGNEAFRIEGNEKHSTLFASNGKQYSATNTETLFLQIVGVALPLTSLQYWIRGLPDPHLPSNPSYDHSNRLAQLQQANWQIIFQNYTTIDSIDLPRFVTLTSSLYKAKVMIYQWQLN